MKELPVYETPQVVSFTEEQILDEMGPAGLQPPPPISQVQ
jgi:hypothetical protein